MNSWKARYERVARVVANANKSRRKRSADTLSERCAPARAGGNRALPSTRLTFPMIVIGSTAKSEGINYPCGFPIPPPLSPAYPSGTQRRRIGTYPERTSPGRTGALFLAEEIRSNFNILFKKEKRVTIVASASPRALPRRSILQHPRKLRYEFPAVTRNVNVRYGSRCGYLRGRFPERFFTKFRDRHFMRNGTYSNFPAYAGKLHDPQVPQLTYIQHRGKPRSLCKCLYVSRGISRNGLVYYYSKTV